MGLDKYYHSYDMGNNLQFNILKTSYKNGKIPINKII